MSARLAAFICFGFWAACGVAWGQDVSGLPPTVGPSRAQPIQPADADLKVDASAQGVRTFDLRRRISVVGAQSCVDAHTIRLGAANAADRPGEVALIEQALRTGKPLRISDGRCVADGVVHGSTVAFEPDANTADLCQVALVPIRPTTCKGFK